MSASTTTKGARLRNLRLHEVSLVDRPANEHATIALHKADAVSATEPSASSRRMERAVSALVMLTGSGAVAARLLKLLASDGVTKSETKRTIPESEIATLIMDTTSDVPARRALSANALKVRRPDLYKLVKENVR